MPALTRKRKRRDRAQRRTVTFLAVFGALIGAVCLAAFATLTLCASWLSDLPDYTNIDSYAKTGITTIYANDRETVLGRVYLENRIQVSRDEVTDDVVNGTIATEDERFYQHSGVDPYGIVRALIVNMRSGGTAEGASTITQQLVRNTVLQDEMTNRSIERKIREMYIAVKVEEIYSKEQILMMYLNVVNYGDGNYGIEAASRDYFGKHASELSLSEAALLIGIPQSPSANNPRDHMDNALARRATVLARMLTNGYITQSEYDEVIGDEPELQKRTSHDDDVKNIAPYFVDYVKQMLNDSGQFSQNEIARGGLSVYTTLDVKAQRAANKTIKEKLKYQNSGLDASLVSINPNTGDIVAMYGGRSYKNDQFNLATQMSRHAGSSFKTFTLLAALKEGVDPDNTYINSEAGTIGKNWEVSNSEGEGGGDMNITDATTYSVNTVYARLCHGIGPQKVVDMAKACGITSELQAYDSITLGTQGVNTLEMADAYATIANGGMHHDPVCITDIINSSGETIYTHSYTEGTRAISAAIAQKATEILETVIEYGTGTSAALDTDQPCAGKTGTSEEGRDLWFCGFTPQYSTAVWTGYRQETKTYMYGSTLSAPIWGAYMNTMLEGQPIKQFPTTSEEISYKDSSNWNFSGYDNEYDSDSEY